MRQIIFSTVVHLFLSCLMNNEQVLAIENIAASITPRVFGGDNADITEFPYVASVRGRGTYFCAACIIGEDELLSAAHCFTHVDGVIWPFLDVSIHTGTSSSVEIGNIHWIRKVTVHPGFVGTWESAMVHDIAHIKLEKGIIFDASQQKVNLPLERTDSFKEVILVSWGDTTPDIQYISEKLQKLKMTTLVYTMCQHSHRKTLYKEHICAYQVPGYGCARGDSGASIVANNEVIGIHSWVRKDCYAAGNPEIFTDVFEERGFIIRAMQAFHQLNNGAY